MLVASLWGDALGGLIIAGALRITLTQHMTFCINSVCHKFGDQTYSDRNTARDNWVTALFTFGEGYHNFHHKFPLDYRNGVRAYHFDPTKWLIRALAFCGLTTSLKRVGDNKIIQYRLDMDKKRLAQLQFAKENDTKKAALHTLHESILQLLSQRATLESAYAALKNKTGDTAAQYRAIRKAQYKELKDVSFKLKCALKMWALMMKTSLLPGKEPSVRGA